MISLEEIRSIQKGDFVKWNEEFMDISPSFKKREPWYEVLGRKSCGRTNCSFFNKHKSGCEGYIVTSTNLGSEVTTDVCVDADADNPESAEEVRVIAVRHAVDNAPPGVNIHEVI